MEQDKEAPLKPGRMASGEVIYKVYAGGLLTIWDDRECVNLSTSEAIALRDFLNSQSKKEAQ